MLSPGQQSISYWYEWNGATIDGELMVPLEMLKLTRNTRVKVLREIAKYFSELNKVVTLDGVVIPYGAARHYSKADSSSVTVHIDGDSPLVVLIHEAGEAIRPV